VRVVRASGLPNRTDSMFTTIEGDNWVGFHKLFFGEPAIRSTVTAPEQQKGRPVEHPYGHKPAIVPSTDQRRSQNHRSATYTPFWNPTACQPTPTRTHKVPRNATRPRPETPDHTARQTWTRSIGHHAE
jgi:hypothetical protein